MNWEGFQQGPCWFSKSFSPCGSGRALWSWKWYNTATMSPGFHKFPKQGRSEGNNTWFELELGLQVPAEQRSLWAFIFPLIQGRFGKTSPSLLPRGTASQGKPLSQRLCCSATLQWAPGFSGGRDGSEMAEMFWVRVGVSRNQTLALAGVGGELHQCAGSSQKAPHRKTGKAPNKFIWPWQALPGSQCGHTDVAAGLHTGSYGSWECGRMGVRWTWRALLWKWGSACGHWLLQAFLWPL